jgi:betaine-aldehyde dehydrogenase
VHQFVAGRRRSALAGDAQPAFDVVDPATGDTVETVALAGAADVDAAVTAARHAFADWSQAAPVERSTVLSRLASILDSRSDELASTESRQTGKPIRLSSGFDVPGTVDNVAFFAGAARNLEGKAAGEYSVDHTSMIRREPIGVVGSIAPWNYPLQMAGWKILPAIAAGNTIVLKPAELTPLTALIFAEAATEAGLPDGVLNVISGTGPVAGEALITHPDVDMVSFTGSSGVGRRVMELASAGPKRVHLELGGKAPFVVFDDADLEAAVQGAVAGSLINSGQDCTAATRAYVQRPLYDAFVAGVADLMSSVRLGDPFDERTDQGPLISRRQQERVAGFVERAREAGAKIVCGGAVPGGALARGAYYEPTVVIANDTPFGLAASAWTRDVYRSLRASREIRAGCVWINDHIPIISEMPHGGYKASGFGKDMSAYSFEDYTNIKHVMYDGTAIARKDWHRTIFRGTAPTEQQMRNQIP